MTGRASVVTTALAYERVRRIPTVYNKDVVMIRGDYIEITHKFYSIEDISKAAASGLPIRLSPEVARKIDEGRDYVMKIASSEDFAYGINTGFGSLCTTKVDQSELSALQHNHLLSHACGVGMIVPELLSRIVVLVKLLTFRSGNSGIGRETLDRVIDLWNQGVVGAIPQKGSVGASGDLAPLAHLALPLIGQGEVWMDGHLIPASEALSRLGMAPVQLGPKEGLCLTNGVQYINGYGVMSLVRAQRLLRLADLCAAMSIQGFCTANTFYDALIHRTSHHPERSVCASNITALTQGSNHYALPQCNAAKEDPYSFRCAPQVHGAVRQVIDFATSSIAKECNSVSDNPLVFPEADKLLTGGNLHGQATAFALDFAAISMSELANISERRTYQLLSGQNGLPDFLISRPGVNSGFMVVQYTSAALVNENKVMSTPASIDTIPTCHLQEDHVSMGGTSAYKLVTVLDNCEIILAIEFLCACQATQLNEGLVLSEPAERLLNAFRKTVPFLEHDLLMSDLINKTHVFLASSPEVNAVLETLE